MSTWPFHGRWEDDLGAIWASMCLSTSWSVWGSALGPKKSRNPETEVTDDRAFGGVLDEIRIWSCVRSREEILDSRRRFWERNSWPSIFP